MDNAVQIFNSSEFGRVRTVVIDSEVWFVGKDIADSLGYSNTTKAVLQHVDQEDRRSDMIPQSQNGPLVSKVNLVNESGLYSLVLDSKLPSAKKFRKWITSEVLPQIRQTGSYVVPQTTAGQIVLLAQGHVELEQKIDAVNDDFQTFKTDLPMLPAEIEEVTRAAKRRGLRVLGGKLSNAYSDRSLVTKVYKDIYSQIHREYGVESFKSIKRREKETVIKLINSYELPLVLKEEIESKNK